MLFVPLEILLLSTTLSGGFLYLYCLIFFSSSVHNLAGSAPFKTTSTSTCKFWIIVFLVSSEPPAKLYATAAFAIALSSLSIWFMLTFDCLIIASNCFLSSGVIEPSCLFFNNLLYSSLALAISSGVFLSKLLNVSTTSAASLIVGVTCPSVGNILFIRICAASLVANMSNLFLPVWRSFLCKYPYFLAFPIADAVLLKYPSFETTFFITLLPTFVVTVVIRLIFLADCEALPNASPPPPKIDFKIFSPANKNDDATISIIKSYELLVIVPYITFTTKTYTIAWNVCTKTHIENSLSQIESDCALPSFNLSQTYISAINGKIIIKNAVINTLLK